MNDGSPPASRPLWARLARFLLVAAGVILLLYGVAAVTVPLLVSKVVLPRLGESLGRQVDIERVRFNPFTLVLSAQGLRIAAAEPAADFLTVAAVRADLSISSLRYLAPVIDVLKIERPIVHLKRTARDRFDFSDIVDRLRAAPAEPDAQPTRFALHN
nr:hypothetical protein [Lautropia sp.]